MAPQKLRMSKDLCLDIGSDGCTIKRKPGALRLHPSDGQIKGLASPFDLIVTKPDPT